MFAERRAVRRLRKHDKAAYATRYASAMLVAREYATKASDPVLAQQMRNLYNDLKKTPIGARIRALGKKRTKA